MPVSAFGVQRLVDSSQNFIKAAAAPVYLRVKKFVDNPVVEDLGFTFTPTNGAPPVGTTDLEIKPQPSVALLSMHSVALAALAGTQLRQGARKVIISNSWVHAQKVAKGYNDPIQVFTDASVIGLISGNLLMEIVSITHNDVYGQAVTWILTCNATEQSLK